MKSRLTLLLLAAALLLPFSQAMAWDSAGHMVIVAGAFRELPRKTQKKVTEILKSHPDYAKWAADDEETRDKIDLPVYVFMRASTWPDEIEHSKGRGSREYNHREWHFIDYPLKPYSFPKLPAPSPGNDILFGIAQSEKVLSDHNAPAEERAVYLSWLIHLVGDIHQPLHCASLVNETYPEGDKGGNEFYVKPASKGIKLHAFWDDLLGRSGKPHTHLDYAIELQSEHPRASLKFLRKHDTPKAWSLESRELAITKAFIHGELSGSTSPESAPPLPKSYTKHAKVTAERQAVLAGYRLADEILKYVK